MHSEELTTTVGPGLEEHFLGCLLGGAVGDALGFTSENLSRERIKKKYGTLRDFRVKPAWAYYTDDTQLTIALAETLLECRGFDADRFRRKLARWWIVIPRLSGRSTKNAALKCLLGIQASGRNVPGSSGAMRAAPLGLYYYDNQDALFQATVEACRITHTHPGAIAGALVAAFSVAYCLQYHGQPLDTGHYLGTIAQVAGEWSKPMAEQLLQLESLLALADEAALPKLLSQSKVFGSPIEDIIQTSVYGFIKYPTDFEQSVIFCANAGWDTDTMAAINGNIAGARNGIHAIPDRWLNNLENGYKGRDYLMLLARSLYKKTPLPPRNVLADYMKDFWRNTGFIYNMVIRKPKM